MSFIKNTITSLRRSKGVRWMRTKSEINTIPGFKDVSLFDAAMQFRRQILDHNIIERASAISYNFAMAIPPMIIFLFTLIPLFPINQQFISEIKSLIGSIVPGQKNYDAITAFLDDFINTPRNGLLSFGFLLSLFFSSNALMGVQRSFDKDYPGFRKRKGLQKRLAALRMILILYLLFISCLVLLIAQGNVLNWLGIDNIFLKDLINYTRWLLIALLYFVIVAYIYRAAPSVDKKWPMVTPGSVLATVLMLIAALGFSWWVSNFGSYNRIIYKSIGTILVIMILIFLNSLILLIGFELNVSIRSVARDRAPSP